MNTRGGTQGRPWRGCLTDEEFLWLRLFAMLDEVQGTLARLRDEPGADHASTVAVLERLRADLVAALSIAVDEAPQRG
jgi:hypothetical protein